MSPIGKIVMNLKTSTVFKFMALKSTVTIKISPHWLHLEGNQLLILKTDKQRKRIKQLYRLANMTCTSK